MFDLLAAQAAHAPDKLAITDGTSRMTYAGLRDATERMAARFRALGIGAEDVVAIQLPNWLEFAPVFFALERIGAVAVTVSTDFRARELEYILRFSEARGFVSASRRKRVSPITSATARPSCIHACSTSARWSMGDQ